MRKMYKRKENNQDSMLSQMPREETVLTEKPWFATTWRRKGKIFA